MSDLNTSYIWNIKKLIYLRKGITLDYFDIDNAATIYSLINRKRAPGVFRLSATFRVPINRNRLQEATNNIISRFPYFQVHLRPGIFWPYWETNYAIPEVLPDLAVPCQKMFINKRNVFPFRILFGSNTISVEFHHSITDGTGALTFLKALICEYFQLEGVNVKDWGEIFRSKQTPHPEEYEDAYLRFASERLPYPQKLKKVFRPPFKNQETGIYNITSVRADVSEVLEISRKFKVSITEFVSAIYIEALQNLLFNLPPDLFEKYSREIRLPVPVNLRKFFPTKSMRNFSFVVSPEIDPRLGKYSFEEILTQVYYGIRGTLNEKRIKQQISRNVAIQKNPFVYGIPIFLKNLLGGILHSTYGERIYSGKISNLGVVNLPTEISYYIQDFNFVLSPSPSLNTGIGMVSFNNVLTFNLTRTIKETHIQDFFFEKLDSFNIDYEITERS